ncbi:MAG: hypothetical protein NZM02_02425 [Patescibacteria group bacterium]|nr:hypothetical protein [Patescibacteria group bacterium]
MRLKKIIFIFFFFILFFILFKELQNSVFLKKKERINILFYGENVKYLSLSSLGINYLLEIPVKTKILVPGGYGFYKVGALGKLASLEKKPEIIERAFSGATSSFVDLYFYSDDKVYYSDSKKESFFSKINFLFFSSSNANFLDRLFLFFKIINKKQSDYKIIKIDFDPFDQEKFNEKYQGIFYKKNYREKKPSLQIIYEKSYSTAYFLSQIINGEGIRVIDLSFEDNNQKMSHCQIITKKIDNISKDLADYFNCQIKKGNPLISDIILKLNSLENQWLIN